MTGPGGGNGVAVWAPVFATATRPDGTILIRQQDALGPFPPRLTDRLRHWAWAAPDRTWLAERDGAGTWRRVSYAGGLAAVRRLGQALLDLGVSAERPLLILSGNDIEHALLGMAAQYCGAAYAPLSPAYSLVSADHGRLRDIARAMTPGLVFAADGSRFAPALSAAFPDVPLAVTSNPPARRDAHLFATLDATEPGAAVDAANRATGPDTVSKFLFTSGSTGAPKPVIQTQRMMCANQVMVADCFRFMQDEPPVVVDWAPWNHVAAGSKVFNMVLWNGGTYYIDAGRPTAEGIATTLRNAAEVSPTWYFNVPAGWEMMVPRFEADPALARGFFARLRMAMYAGAGLAAHTWAALERISLQVTGNPVLLITGLGATETAPAALQNAFRQTGPGNVGVPMRGVTLKLLPVEDRLEARLKGPTMTPGYWRDPSLTAAAFDDEGFYRLGDALRFAEPGNPAAGFFFDGRIAENFKLRTGTWVSVGPLRAALIDQFGGLLRDVVIAGEGQDMLGALAFPDIATLRALAPDAGDTASLLADPRVRAAFEARLSDHAARATGSATRVRRLIVMAEPPSLDRGEATDKGSINQRAVLRHRAALVARLADPDARDVIRV